MTVNSLRVMSECATTVAASISVSCDLVDVQVSDAFSDRSVSVQSLPRRRPGYTPPQYVQADGRVSGETLTSGSVNLTLGIGVRRGGLVLVSLVTETSPSFSAPFFSHRLWDGYLL